MTIIITIFTLVVLVTFAYTGLSAAPWVPTINKDIDRFLGLVDISPGQKVYDLGCGDGRLVCAAARAGADAQGFELSILPFLLANIRRLFQNEKNRIKISYRNLWNVDLRDADVVYFFLMPKAYPKLKKKFEKELKKGTKVISYVWPIEGWEYIIKDEQKGRAKLFLYRV